MDVWIPVVAALISATAALVSVWYARRAARSERLDEAEKISTRFREPLLQAVFNLETRVYNVLENGFFDRFLGQGNTVAEREYVELNTIYVLGQYFCWVEIIRRESQFMDPRRVAVNRTVAHALEDVRDTMADSLTNPDPAFRLFRGEQRAIAEVMLVPVREPAPGAPRFDCLGYAAFVRAVTHDDDVARWFQTLRESIALSHEDPARGAARLRRLQRGLVDIIDALDPEYTRIPESLRRRVRVPDGPLPPRERER